MENDLAGKKIVISGAANGLGYAMADCLARSGAQLVLTDINGEAVQQAAKRLAEQYAADVAGVQHDVSQESSWQSLYQAVSARWSQLDGLVNNAGIMIHRPFIHTTLEDFRKTQSINVESVFIGVQTFLPLLKVGGESGAASSIVNVSSVFGQVAGPIHSAYCASKGAVRLLSKSIATELPKLGYNIRCNSIHPGVMDAGVSVTGMQALVDMGLFESPEQAYAYFGTVIPIGRAGRADEIAEGVAFLLSAKSSLMTGAELTLDGGYTAI